MYCKYLMQSCPFVLQISCIWEWFFNVSIHRYITGQRGYGLFLRLKFVMDADHAHGAYVFT